MHLQEKQGHAVANGQQSVRSGTEMRGISFTSLGALPSTARGAQRADAAINGRAGISTSNF